MFKTGFKPLLFYREATLSLCTYYCSLKTDTESFSFKFSPSGTSSLNLADMMDSENIALPYLCVLRFKNWDHRTLPSLSSWVLVATGFCWPGLRLLFSWIEEYFCSMRLCYLEVKLRSFSPPKEISLIVTSYFINAD